jgi:3'-phosphoadenosine 5'-phosphosulfate sulfotransferase (PAPS reductase)/FAD synthetase
MKYVLSLSGGKASAVAADRAIARYGKEAVTLWFADTAWEDEDLYRFLNDCVLRWGCEFVTYRDGRTPLQVAEDHKIISNQRMAPCTHDLKIKPFRRYIESLPKPLTVLIGLDWREQHRMARPKANYEALEGVSVDFPLMWTPYEYRPYETVIRDWGIEPPRLYAYGFPHNNCGGRCVKQGIAEWLRLRDTFPERFAEVRDWEQAQRAKGEARANYAIARDQSGGDVKPLTLAEIESRDAEQQAACGMEDMFSCFCSAE